MRAIVFDLSLPRYALGKAFGKQVPSLYWGPLSCVSLREVPEPPLRGPAWATIAVEATGFCGSDLAAVMLKMSPAMSPFSSFPAVLGHEIFGRLREVGAEARAAGFREGDITHSFPLEQYREAIVANVDRGKSKAMKTVFKPAVRA